MLITDTVSKDTVEEPKLYNINSPFKMSTKIR